MVYTKAHTGIRPVSNPRHRGLLDVFRFLPFLPGIDRLGGLQLLQTYCPKAGPVEALGRTHVLKENEMTNYKYDFVIIGGGPNGLCVAAYLSKAGQKVVDRA